MHLMVRAYIHVSQKSEQLLSGIILIFTPSLSHTLFFFLTLSLSIASYVSSLFYHSFYLNPLLSQLFSPFFLFVDYAALRELKEKPLWREKFGLTAEMVEPFEVVPIIGT